MLNEQDLDHIRANREAITQLRTVLVTLHGRGETGAVDPLTGEAAIGVTETPAECTWSNLTSGGPGSDDITMVGGVLAEAGDAIANFDIAYDMDGVTHVTYDGVRWRVRSSDKIGLGVPNRHYVLLRQVT